MSWRNLHAWCARALQQQPRNTTTGHQPTVAELHALLLQAPAGRRLHHQAVRQWQSGLTASSFSSRALAARASSAGRRNSRVGCPGRVAAVPPTGMGGGPGPSPTLDLSSELASQLKVLLTAAPQLSSSSATVVSLMHDGALGQGCWQEQLWPLRSRASSTVLNQ